MLGDLPLCGNSSALCLLFLGSDYIGCFEDRGDRAMLMKRVDDDAMTLRKCLAICAKDGKSQLKVMHMHIHIIRLWRLKLSFRCVFSSSAPKGT